MIDCIYLVEFHKCVDWNLEKVDRRIVSKQHDLGLCLQQRIFGVYLSSPSHSQHSQILNDKRVPRSEFHETTAQRNHVFRVTTRGKCIICRQWLPTGCFVLSPSTSTIVKMRLYAMPKSGNCYIVAWMFHRLESFHRENGCGDFPLSTAAPRLHHFCGQEFQWPTSAAVGVR